MALLKQMELDNGITTNYHRVVSVNNITNVCSLIEVASYISYNKRLEEQTAMQEGAPMNVFIHTEYFNADYDETMNVVSAYDYLKTLDKFKDADNA